MRNRGLRIAIVSAVAVGAACTVDLDASIACGDGYVDPRSAEECDPGDLSSFMDACRPEYPLGTADCDPVSCQIIATPFQCAACGDGKVDPGEECDSDDLDGHKCPGGDDSGLRCASDCTLDYSNCPTCGNGMRDEGEECDPNEGGIVNPRQCAGTEDIPPLDSPYPMLPYTSGETTRCEDDCRFDRLPCSYCGNDTLNDQPILVDLKGHTTLPEWCDGDAFDDAKLMQQYGSTCYELDPELEMRPNVGCQENCLGFVDQGGPECCIAKGERCPADDDQFRCCYEFLHPEDSQACDVVIDTQGLAKEVCK